MTADTAARIQDRIDRQHSEIRRMIMSEGPLDVSFREALLQELSVEHVRRELVPQTSGQATRKSAGTQPAKKAPIDASSALRPQKDAASSPPAKKGQTQVAALQQQVQVLELKMAASHRVRQHLEASIHALTSELDANDGSKQFFEGYKQRLAKENARLSELLEDEHEARRHAEAAQLDGIHDMWAKFQSAITAERESYTRLEGSRNALIVQQRNAQAEIEDNRRQIQELGQIRKQLQRELVDAKEHLDAEALAKNEEAKAPGTGARE
ncbi:hypothetical protein BC834DRAFT_65181 [Gloeopeniophorella convolvens]|nr:hypothetical protein BC834DRAFT_65181 [Gloeopeniophorella convolvens]